MDSENVKDPYFESMTQWIAKFNEMAKQAGSEGFTVFVGISYTDNMTDQSGSTYTSRGDHMSVLGLLTAHQELLKHHFVKHELGEED